MSEHTASTEKSLRWRCRRGMQELDVLLLAFLDHHYPHADQATKQAFANLLQQADDLLWDWLSGRGESHDATMQALIERIRRR